MKKDMIEGRWKEIRGEDGTWCGKLTEDDLDWDARRFDAVTGLILEELVQTRRHASEAIDKRMLEYEFKLTGKHVPPVQ